MNILSVKSAIKKQREKDAKARGRHSRIETLISGTLSHRIRTITMR